jgi:hypothetical protein
MPAISAATHLVASPLKIGRYGSSSTLGLGDLEAPDHR